MRGTSAAILVAVLLASQSALGAGGFKLLDPSAYQSFVQNWTPDTAPLCAAIDTAAKWDRVLHAAPTMGANKSYAPPADFWGQHAVLLFARVVNAGDASSVFQVQDVVRRADTADVTLRFTPPPPASSTMKAYFAVAIDKPLPTRIRFIQDGSIVCVLDTAAGKWMAAPPQP